MNVDSVSLVKVVVVHTETAATSQAVQAALSPADRVRADRFRSPHAASRFIRARAALRFVLGAETGVPPPQLAFDVTCVRCGRPHGKPRIAGPNFQHVDFSHSYTDGVAAVAVSRLPVRVGIDVEDANGITAAWDALAGGILTPAERTRVVASPVSQRLSDVVEVWTKKEAVLKAAALGLILDPRDIETRPDGTVGWANFPAFPKDSDRDSSFSPSEWTVRRIRDAQPLTCSVAWSSANATIQFRRSTLDELIRARPLS